MKDKINCQDSISFENIDLLKDESSIGNPSDAENIPSGKFWGPMIRQISDKFVVALKHGSLQYKIYVNILYDNNIIIDFSDCETPDLVLPGNLDCCPICAEKFDNGVYQLVVLSSCGHILCYNCAENLLKDPFGTSKKFSKF